MGARVLLPSWVVPTIDAVQECERVASRLCSTGRTATPRDWGVSSTFVWLTVGEVSPMTWRPCSESAYSTIPDNEPGVEPVQAWGGPAG